MGFGIEDAFNIGVNMIGYFIRKRKPVITTTIPTTQDLEADVQRLYDSETPKTLLEEKPMPIVSVKEKTTRAEQTASVEAKSMLVLPSSEETKRELKRRLGKELYKAELDLSTKLRIANKPCDCLSQKHTLLLEAAAEELIPFEPDNTVYSEIIAWVNQNQSKLTPEAIATGKYDSEYLQMSTQFKNFRKRVMGTVGTGSLPKSILNLEEAKKMAAEEAAKEVEKVWNSQEKT